MMMWCDDADGVICMLLMVHDDDGWQGEAQKTLGELIGPRRLIGRLVERGSELR